jgi:hypothetical protein
MALKDSIRLPKENMNIPTKRFGENRLTAWAFKDQAKNYGLFLSANGVDKMPVEVVDSNYIKKQKKPFGRPVWFRKLIDRSALLCYLRDFCVDHWARGVRENAEGVAQPVRYSMDQFRSALQVQGISGRLEQAILDSLKV